MSDRDPFFGMPSIDADEWRDVPARHRYVHGGFEGTDTRFSIYLPPPERYQGRSFSVLEGGWAGNEHTVQTVFGERFGGLELIFTLGGFLSESNQGHLGTDLSGLRGDTTIQDYRASLQTCRFACSLAEEMYGEVPHHRYVYGGSGGGHRTVRCLEESTEWDGGLAFLVPLQRSGVRIHGARQRASRWLAPVADSIIDAMDEGGSGDPFAGLTARQRDALADLYQTGYPRGAEFLLWNLYGLIDTMFNSLTGMENIRDSGYADEFWSVPGYLGHDRPEMFADVLVDEPATVARIVSADELAADTGPDFFELRSRIQPLPHAPFRGNMQPMVGVVFDGFDMSRLWMGDHVVVQSGAAAGREAVAKGVLGGAQVFAAADVDGLEPGDAVHLSNRRFLADLYLDFSNAELDPFWRRIGLDLPVVDGQPVYPQRPHPYNRNLLCRPAHTGRFSGKMLMVQSALDCSIASPLAAHAYRTLVNSLYEPSEVTDRFRLWFTERAHHGFSERMGPRPDVAPVSTNRLIDYSGIIAHGLEALVSWVEDGVAPPADTGYAMSPDLRLELASTASERCGLQPVVKLTANGSTCAQVAPGEPVTLKVDIEVPPRAGTLLGLEWDLDGTGAYIPGGDGIVGKTHAQIGLTHTYQTAGTYVIAARTASAPDDTVGQTRPIYNLGRVRVIVS
jgi:hypothetical protein